jgi:hypothetical protein
VRPSLLTFVLCGGGFSGIEGVVTIEDLVHEAHDRAATSWRGSRRREPSRAPASRREPVFQSGAVKTLNV